MIKIKVKFYGGLHTRYPNLPLGQALTCETAAGTTVAQLLSEQLHLPPDIVAIALVNGKREDFSRPLKEGDLLVLFPPVAGGI